MVEVYDKFYPATKDIAKVNITVIRNPNPPRFSQDRYDANNINEYQPLNDHVYLVSAGDADRV